MLKMPSEHHFWCEKEEEYLILLHKTCLELVTVYRKLYVSTSRLQNKLRLPSIIMSSLSGAASFGSSSFASWSSNPEKTQKYINVSIGLVNVFIAMVQTYESFKKVGDIISKSISASISLKKLAEDIHCIVFIPAGDRETNGITYLRDAFNKYQSIMEQAPPLEHSTKDYLRFEEVKNKIKLRLLKKQGKEVINRDDKNSKSSTKKTSQPFPSDSIPYFQQPRERSESMDSYTSTSFRNKKIDETTEETEETEEREDITNTDEYV